MISFFSEGFVHVNRLCLKVFMPLEEVPKGISNLVVLDVCGLTYGFDFSTHYLYKELPGFNTLD